MSVRRARPPRRRGSLVAVGGVLALALSAAACSPSVPSDNAQATPSAETSSPAPSASESATPTPSGTDTATPTPSGLPSGTPVATPVGSPVGTPGATPAPSSPAPAPVPTGPPPVLDRAAANRDLTIADFFAAPVEWRGGQFDVASERGLTGISGPIRTCLTDEASAQTFELRLANNFSRISLRFGEANDSESSDAELMVRLVGNGTFIDSQRVKFNKLESLQVPVSAVNALKIQVYATGKGCDENKVVNAVLTGVRLE